MYLTNLVFINYNKSGDNMNRICILNSEFLLEEETHKKYIKEISPKRLERYNQIKSLKQKALSLGASLILNLKKEEEFFSISHSFPYAAVSFSDKKTGIDIERIKSFNENIPARFFSLKEREYINNSSDKNKAFFTLWTLKESAAKFYGTPILKALKIYEFIPEGNFFMKDNIYCSVFYKDGFVISALSENQYFTEELNIFR